MRYEYTTNGNRCRLKDSETGLVILWEKSGFNDTQQCFTDGLSGIPEEHDLASFLASSLNRMAEWLIENHPESI